MQIQIGIITISDRASKGLYDDLGGPALKKAAEGYGWKVLGDALVPDEKRDIQRAIRELIGKGCSLILTTGGTGVALRDDELLRKVFGAVYDTLPKPVRRFVGEETFIEFCFKHRQRLLGSKS